jgi:hypothetical protein
VQIRGINIGFRLWGVIENCSICPIVYNVYEYLKDELRHNDFDDYPDEYDDFDPDGTDVP